MSELEQKGKVVRSATDEIRIYSGEYWKTHVIDFRWYQNDKPTKKGIRMNVDEAKILHQILADILEEIDYNVETIQ